MYTEETILTFGKYKFQRIKNVPLHYLQKMYDNPNGCPDAELVDFLKTHPGILLNIIRDEAPPPDFICSKITYPSEAEAKFHLRNIKNRGGDHKKPYRAYECPDCSGWHLTSQEDRDYIKRATM